MMTNIHEQLANYYDEDNTFGQSEAEKVVENYVCPVCYGELRIMWVPNIERVLVVCSEHGNVCQIGRITRATVSIQTEASFRNFHQAIRNLPDLWGDLIDQGFDYKQANIITRTHVCAICGSLLITQSRPDYPYMDIVNIICSARHGNINDTGYVRRNEFIYDFQRIRAWEKQKRENNKEK